MLDYNKSAKFTAFEYTSSRKEERSVLDYFSYDKVFNKNTCLVVETTDDENFEKGVMSSNGDDDDHEI